MPEKGHEAHKDDWFQDHPFGDELKSLHNTKKTRYYTNMVVMPFSVLSNK
jgi:hypothetical protein